MAKWPTSLPIPTITNIEHIHTYECELLTSEDIDILHHDIYWYEDHLFYLYYEHNKGCKTVLSTLEEHGIIHKSIEPYYFRHPANTESFIHFPRDKRDNFLSPDVAEGTMYGKITLKLSSKVRKQHDFQISAQATSDAIRESESLFNFRINILIGYINLNRYKSKLIRFFKDFVK